ncbi:histidine N-alpha-methyltransferase [Kineosporia sp. NBRC 101677]|uniref:L-histidine N(alpha)-methyltransferase n=1 Tax=Kineosporia sp. NBRC 101677 TaxID=3032197 RepID=UPI0024A260B8|nr:L-histidine N(alpha)-methyltransferase [Kineosporia sp. NBRC 101677]GLY13432.1 histidine N-alpha-methyltransferase [Kineosporia sp. NBRC 101677]
MPYRFTDLLPEDFSDSALRADVRKGLTARPKQLPPKWFYDKTGSELFEEITRLPEYYQTRSERAILQAGAARIVASAGARHLVELGSGSSEKTRLLLDHLRAPGSVYTALDVSGSALRQAAEALGVTYPDLRIEAVRADFEQHLPTVLGDGLTGRGRGGRLVVFLGGTIGNLQPAERAAFLAGVRAGLDPGDAFLLGADLVKSPDVLIPAYDDAAGVTAAFNLNLLQVLNSRLGADFDPDDFTHRAVWDESQAWIEMRLRAGRRVEVRLAELDLVAEFEAGEELRTEISAKFTAGRLESELTAAGFAADGWWTDPDGQFSLSMWRPA